jgi:thioredoxin reductase
MSTTNTNGIWDCVVVGAGAAGLSAGLVLGRARRTTLIVDAGEQSNRVAEAVGGFIGADGHPPAELYERARAGLDPYGSVELRPGSVIAGSRDSDLFLLRTEAGSIERARTVVVATGMEYRPPDVPGIAERWGRSVFHCPFCHGWEVRGGRLGVLDSDEGAVHRGLLLTSWSDDVTVYTNGDPEPTDPALAAAGVAVDTRPVAELAGAGAELDAIRFADGDERACDALLVPVTMHQRTALATQLGAGIAEAGPIAADAIRADERGITTVSGLFAAGDITGRMPSVANAVASGSNAAAAVVQHLTATPARG